MAHPMRNTATDDQAQSPIASDALAALVASRICHDLVSPIGAIGNGLELLELSQSNATPEMEMIAESLRHANLRLRLYRLAFGTAGDGTQIGAGEIGSLIAGLNGTGRIQLRWQAPAELARRRARLVFLLILCLETAIPWGGEITVEGADADCVLTARAERLTCDEGTWALLSDTGQAQGATLPAARVQFAIAAAELQVLGLRITRETGSSSLSLRLSPAATAE